MEKAASDFDLAFESLRTQPDYIVHCPKSLEQNDASNQHFLFS